MQPDTATIIIAAMRFIALISSCYLSLRIHRYIDRGTVFALRALSKKQGANASAGAARYHWRKRTRDVGGPVSEPVVIKLVVVAITPWFGGGDDKISLLRFTYCEQFTDI